MGFVGDVMGSVMGKGGAKSASYAPQTGYQAEYRAVGDEGRQRYQDQINALNSGQGPSVADQYVQNAQQQNLAQALAMARSTRGDVNPAMAYRQALQAAAQGNQQAVQQGAMMRAQEGIAGRQLAANYAQMGLQEDLANQGAWGQAQGINAGIATQNLGSQTSFGTTGMTQTGQTFQGIMSGLSGGMAKASTGGGGMAHGGYVTLADALKQNGGIVPGSAMYPGDNPKNDTVHAMLSPGEIVIPRSLAEDPDRAKKFIEALKKEKDEGPSYGKVLAAKRKKSA